MTLLFCSFFILFIEQEFSRKALGQFRTCASALIGVHKRSTELGLV